MLALPLPAVNRDRLFSKHCAVAQHSALHSTLHDGTLQLRQLKQPPPNPATQLPSRHSQPGQRQVIHMRCLKAGRPSPNVGKSAAAASCQGCNATLLAKEARSHIRELSCRQTRLPTPLLQPVMAVQRSACVGSTAATTRPVQCCSSHVVPPAIDSHPLTQHTNHGHCSPYARAAFPTASNCQAWQPLTPQYTRKGSANTNRSPWEGILSPVQEGNH